MKVILETTADGSPTLYREDLNEHYHSVKGALAESCHVYVDCGWEYVARKRHDVRVFEVGFGTGLNAALTALSALEAGVHTEYFSVELFPLSLSVALNYSRELPESIRAAFRAVNEAVWDEAVRINPYFTIHKLDADLRIIKMPEAIDVVYFDAFAPEKQPEMWEAQVITKIYESMRNGGVLTTYCAKGAIRRLLEHTGFRCERLPGPPGGKREILRATRI